MSYLDRQILFSNEQAITASAASADVIDLGSSRDIGAGEPVMVLVQVTQSFDALTSLPLASLTAGARFTAGPVPGGVLRYLRLYYTVTGSNPTTGKITAGCGVEGVHQDTAIYPDSL
jgi:hypothetical protein